MLKWIIIVLSISTLAFGADDEKKEQGLYTVKKQKLTRSLFFSGTVKPIRVKNVTSPIEGVVVEKLFDYGQPVKEGEPLVKLNSTSLEKEYHQALKVYLDTKEKFFIEQDKFRGEERLYELGITSDEDIRGKKSSLNNSNISYLQSLYNLDETIKKGEQITDDVTKLDIADVEAVDKALKLKYNFLSVPAIGDGIALLPSDSGSRDSRGIEVGSQLKLGDVIAVIGDLSGLSFDVHVTEVDVGQVKPGQKVFITGVAFPKYRLEGEVKRIDSQASSSMGSGGGLPTFGVKIEIAELNPDQLRIIKMGMSAKIQLNIEQEGGIEVPIVAVHENEEDGSAYVMLMKEDKPTQTQVLTGQTEQEMVEILVGLKEGDQIVIPH